MFEGCLYYVYIKILSQILVNSYELACILCFLCHWF
jgi:hypothetical protein